MYNLCFYFTFLLFMLASGYSGYPKDSTAVKHLGLLNHDFCGLLHPTMSK